MHLKYASDDDLKQIGLSRPEIRRLRKFYEKYYPNGYLGKIKRLLQNPKPADMVRDVVRSRPPSIFQSTPYDSSSDVITWPIISLTLSYFYSLQIADFAVPYVDELAERGQLHKQGADGRIILQQGAAFQQTYHSCGCHNHQQTTGRRGVWHRAAGRVDCERQRTGTYFTTKLSRITQQLSNQLLLRWLFIRGN